MSKIPVGATIARAYGFAFGDFFKILGVVWFPWAIVSAASYVAMARAMSFASAAQAHDVAAMAQIWIYLTPLYLLMPILICMQLTGITQLALGYFPLGTPVWRLLGAFLLSGRAA
jgi:hypothetical protein